MSKDFLRQVLTTTFPGAHEADHYSTARFHESDAWLSFTLCHCSNEHVIRLEFRQSVRRLVHHNSSVRRTSSTTRNTDRAPISEWNVCCVVCRSRSICRWFRKEYVVFLQFSSHQKYRAVRLDPHRRLLVDHQLSLVSLGTIVAVDFLIHVICRVLSSHHHHFARWDSIQ